MVLTTKQLFLLPNNVYSSLYVMNKSTPIVNRLMKHLEAQIVVGSVLGLNRKQAIIIGLCLHSEYTKRKVLALLKAVSCDTKTTKV